MNKIYLTLLSTVCVFSLGIAQSTAVLSPSQCASLGYHTGYNAENTNYNNAAQFAAFCIPGAQTGVNSNRALMQFDFSGIPAGSTIYSASLSLHKIPSIGFLSNHTIGNSNCIFMPVTENWNQSTVTWNSAPAVTHTGEVNLPASVSGTEDYTVDLTAMVQNQVNNPSQNFGFLFRLVDETPERVLMFASDTYSNSAMRPSLTVSYCPPPTTVFVNALSPTQFCEGGTVVLQTNQNTASGISLNLTWNDDNTENPRMVSNPGEYFVRSVNGCPVLSNSIQVSHFPNPAQPIISPSGNISITAGSSVTFTSSAASAYIWQPNGETTSSITVSEEGAFRVQIFDENGCTATSEEVTVSVIAPPPPPLNTCSAIAVMDYAPKKRNDGSTLPPSRTVSTRALFDPQNSDLETSEENLNFVALGFGGSIVLRMSGAVANGPGDDIQVFETTFTPDAGRCNRYPEKVRVYASQDNCNWVYLGEGCQDVSVDLGVLNWAEFIRLEDVSPVDHPFNNSVADGYDVDGVVCLNGTIENPIAQNLGGMYATEVSSFEQMLRRDGSAVPLSRSNPALALGAPQNTNVVNFVSLGFGGAITLKLGYVVFDKDGADLQVVETSFGNPACTSYPEKASVQVSLDGVNFTDLGEICQDGSVDFATAGINAVQYVRIQDRTMASYFSGSADAYDVDGIVVLQPGCNTTSAPLAKWEDNIQTPDEVQLMNAQAQWQEDQIKLTLSGSDQNENAVITILSLDGKEMYRGTRSILAGAQSTEFIAAQHLASGLYVVRVQTESAQVISKVVKP